MTVRDDPPTEPVVDALTSDVVTDEAFELPSELQAYLDGLYKDNAGTRDELDKTLITLSTVTMGVVLTLRQQIANANPEVPLGFSPPFWWAVYALFTCITVVLVSHFVSMAVNQRIIRAIEGLTQWDGAAHEALTRVQQNVRWVKALNVLSALAFLVGLGCSVGYITTIAK